LKEIPLTQGQVALVDDADFDELNKYKWCANNQHGHWYAHRGFSVNGKNQIVTMHAQILGTPKGMDSDHKDNNGLHNWRDNLRVCSHQKNMENQKKRAGNYTSAFKGVSWNKKANKWHVQICVNGKVFRLGKFTDETKAALVYDEAAKEYFGEFAVLNFREV